MEITAETLNSTNPDDTLPSLPTNYINVSDNSSTPPTKTETGLNIKKAGSEAMIKIKSAANASLSVGRRGAGRVRACDE